MSDPAEEIPELTAAPPEKSLFERVAQNKLGVLAVLFCVTGFLGLPLLVASPRFSRTEKWCWGVVNTIYTSLLIAAVGYLMWYTYQLWTALLKQ